MGLPPEVAKAIKAVNKKFGGSDDSGVAVVASGDLHANVPRFRTGIFSLDMATGGGIPKYRFTRIVGPYSAGKSAIATRVVGNMHAEDPESLCLWIDAEGSWTNEWSAVFGVDLDRVVVARPETGESGIDMVKAFLQTGVFDLVVVDSIAALVPQREIDTSAEDANMAIQARMMNRAMREWVGMSNSLRSRDGAKQPTFILINQVRESMDQYVMEVTPGGKGQDFASSLDIRVERKKLITDKGKMKGLDAHAEAVGNPVAALSQFLVKKSKVSPSGRAGTFTLYFDEGNGRKKGTVECVDALFEYSMRLGAMSKVGGSYVVTSTGEVLTTKKDEVLQIITQKSDVANALADDVLRKLEHGEEEAVAAGEAEQTDPLLAQSGQAS